jgi:hypothetical protein
METPSATGHSRKPSTANVTKALALAAGGVAICSAGIYVGETDDAPGAGVGGIVLMLVMFVFAYRAVRRKA